MFSIVKKNQKTGIQILLVVLTVMVTISVKTVFATDPELVTMYSMLPNYLNSNLNMAQPTVNSTNLFDYSGIAYNESQGTFMVVDDETGFLVEYDADLLLADRFTPPERYIDTSSVIGNSKLEGITYMGVTDGGAGHLYAVVNSHPDQIYVLNVPVNDNSLVQVVHTIDPGIFGTHLAGFAMEGIAYKRFSTYESEQSLLTFYLARQNGPYLYEVIYDPLLEVVVSMQELPEINRTWREISDIYVSPWDETLFILDNHWNKERVYQYDLRTGEQVNYTVIDPESRFKNPQGITFDPVLGQMYIVGAGHDEGDRPEFAVYELPNTPVWTSWLDRDNPSSFGSGPWSGDWELREKLFPPSSQACQSPIGVKAKKRKNAIANYFVPGFDASSVPAIGYFDKLTPEDGLYCINNRHPNGLCPDYQVQFLCMEE